MVRQEIYNVKRVTNVNIIVIIATVLVICVQDFISGGLSAFVDTGLKGAAVLALTALVYFLPLQKYVKGFFVSIIPGIIAVGILLLSGFSIDKHYIIFAALTMAGLYFKKELIVAYGAVMNIAIFVAYALKPANIAGDESMLADFLSLIILLNAAVVLIFLLNKWGRNLLNEVSGKEAEAEELLGRLEDTMNTLREGTAKLDGDIGNFNFSLNSTKEASNNIASEMQEMAKVIQQEAEGVAGISGIMSDSIENIGKAREVTGNIVEQSSAIIEKVEDGWSKLRQAGEQMETIGSAMDKAAETAALLQKSMNSIVASLDGIRQIADQTNMLALNAAIESARAGEHGKGFAVVAEEVRRLAEQSAKMVGDITAVVQDITAKSTDTLNVVTAGNTAANAGKGLLRDLSEYFGQVRQAFLQTNADIAKGMEMFTFITENYLKTQKEIEAIASISEENAASVEEILATVEGENQQINQISKSIDSMAELGRKLKELANSGR